MGFLNFLYIIITPFTLDLNFLNLCFKGFFVFFHMFFLLLSNVLGGIFDFSHLIFFVNLGFRRGYFSLSNY
jgi:hypothetical protein